MALDETNHSKGQVPSTNSNSMEISNHPNQIVETLKPLARIRTLVYVMVVLFTLGPWPPKVGTSSVPTRISRESEVSGKGPNVASSLCKCQVMSGPERQSGLVKCANIAKLEQFCVPRPGSKGTTRHLKVEQIDFDRLYITRDILENRLFMNVSTLESIVIVSSSMLQKLVICGQTDYDNQIMVPCGSFSSLEYLDFRNNSLSYVGPLMDLPHLQSMFLSGNPWPCFDVIQVPTPVPNPNGLTWILEFREQFQDVSSTFCAKHEHNQWSQIVVTQPSSRVSNVTLIDYLNSFHQMDEACPFECVCEIFSIVPPFKISVDCSNLNLTELPQLVPDNTQILNVENNHISSLSALRTNLLYQHLSKLHAANNEILTLSDLQGSPLLANKPTTIDLRGNLLTDFDLFVLEPTLRSVKSVHFDALNFMFGNNPWDCGCDSLKETQDFIYAYGSYIRDAQQMACGKSGAPKIVSARYLELCTPHHFDYLLWITILEAILLLLVCSKLIYDIVQYRRTGQLPWLARMLCIGCSHSNSKSHYTRNQERRKSSFWGCGTFRRSSQQTLSLESSEPGRRFTLDAFRPGRFTSLSNIVKSSSKLTTTPLSQNKRGMRPDSQSISSLVGMELAAFENGGKSDTVV